MVKHLFLFHHYLYLIVHRLHHLVRIHQPCLHLVNDRQQVPFPRDLLFNVLQDFLIVYDPLDGLLVGSHKILIDLAVVAGANLVEEPLEDREVLTQNQLGLVADEKHRVYLLFVLLDAKLERLEIKTLARNI